MFEIEFAYAGETHTMLCGMRDSEVQVSHSEMLEASSQMDELVMEDMAESFVRNCSAYFRE